MRCCTWTSACKAFAHMTSHNQTKHAVSCVKVANQLARDTLVSVLHRPTTPPRPALSIWVTRLTTPGFHLRAPPAVRAWPGDCGGAERQAAPQSGPAQGGGRGLGHGHVGGGDQRRQRGGGHEGGVRGEQQLQQGGGGKEEVGAGVCVGQPVAGGNRRGRRRQQGGVAGARTCKSAAAKGWARRRGWWLRVAGWEEGLRTLGRRACYLLV